MEVIRVPETDQLKPVPTIRVRTFFILRKRLNEQVLRDALDQLIRHHWRKLGARLAKRSEDGLLEYHFPREFKENYVLFNWTSKQNAQSIATVGLPKATPPELGITLQPHTEDIENQLSPSEWPFDRKEELSGAPLLFVHLTQFTDASCVALNYPHAVSDQFGLSRIVKAWLGLVRGEEPPPMLGAHDDFLATDQKKYADYDRAEVTRKGRIRVRRTGHYAAAILPMIPDLIMHKKELKHTLFIPLPLVQSLQDKHSKALKEKYGKDAGISQNDIVAAIMLKLSRIHHKTPRMLALTQTMQLRGRLPILQGEKCDGFIHNSAGYSTARFQFDPSAPISEIAHQNRQALLHAVDPKDAEIGLAVVREMVRRGQPNLTCEPFERFYHVTNWTAAWKGLDFSPAFETPKKEGAEQTTSELFVLGSGAPRNLPLRFVTTVTCKTSDGYYINYSAPVKAVKLAKEYLKKDPMLEGF